MKGKNEQAKFNNDCTRRDFIRATALAVGAAGTVSALGIPSVKATEQSKGLPLTLGGYKTDRVREIVDGSVKIEGCEIQFQEDGIGDLNSNVFSGPQTLDVTEIGLQPFMIAYANDGFRDYTLLPIFPLRQFRRR